MIAFHKFEYKMVSKCKCRLTILIGIFALIGYTYGQNLPIDNLTKKVVYSDLIVFDTLNPDTAFANMIMYANSIPAKYKNIKIDSLSRRINFKSVFNCYSDFPNEFGKIECDVEVRFVSNKFKYMITNFKQIPFNDYPPCSSNLEEIMPECFKGQPFEKYWEKVKKYAIIQMNDFILMLYYVSLENQSTRKTIKMNDYFLSRNRM